MCRFIGQDIKTTIRVGSKAPTCHSVTPIVDKDGKLVSVDAELTIDHDDMLLLFETDWKLLGQGQCKARTAKRTLMCADFLDIAGGNGNVSQCRIDHAATERYARSDKPS
jgi:hypothetical protein